MSGLPSWAPILGAATGNPIWAILAQQESENRRRAHQVAHGQLLASQAQFQAPSGWRNQLGAEGWEQVSHVLLENTVGGPLRGWPQVGTPVTQEWTFKRPLDSGGFL